MLISLPSASDPYSPRKLAEPSTGTTPFGQANRQQQPVPSVIGAFGFTELATLATSDFLEGNGQAQQRYRQQSQTNASATSSSLGVAPAPANATFAPLTFGKNNDGQRPITTPTDMRTVSPFAPHAPDWNSRTLGSGANYDGTLPSTIPVEAHAPFPSSLASPGPGPTSTLNGKLGTFGSGAKSDVQQLNTTPAEAQKPLIALLASSGQVPSLMPNTKSSASGSGANDKNQIRSMTPAEARKPLVGVFAALKQNPPAPNIVVGASGSETNNDGRLPNMTRVAVHAPISNALAAPVQHPTATPRAEFGASDSEANTNVRQSSTTPAEAHNSPVAVPASSALMLPLVPGVNTIASDSGPVTTPVEPHTNSCTSLLPLRQNPLVGDFSFHVPMFRTNRNSQPPSTTPVESRNNILGQLAPDGSNPLSASSIGSSSGTSQSRPTVGLSKSRTSLLSDFGQKYHQKTRPVQQPNSGASPRLSSPTSNKGKSREDDPHSMLGQEAEPSRKRELEKGEHRQIILETPAPETFDCLICQETFRVDFVALIEGCGHKFCRECLKQYVVSKLDDGRYPMVCPMCSTDTSDQHPSCKLFERLLRVLYLSLPLFAPMFKRSRHL